MIKRLISKRLVQIKKVPVPINSSQNKTISNNSTNISKKGVFGSLFALPPLQRLSVILWFSGLGFLMLYIIGDDTSSSINTFNNTSKEEKKPFLEWVVDMARKDYDQRKQ